MDNPELFVAVVGAIVAVAVVFFGYREQWGARVIVGMLVVSFVETYGISEWASYRTFALTDYDRILLFLCFTLINEACVWLWRDETKRAASDDRTAAQKEREDAQKETKAAKKIAEKNLKALKEGRDPIVTPLQKQLHVCELHLVKQEPPLCIYDPQHEPYIKEVAPHYLDALLERLGLPPRSNKKEEEPPQIPAKTPPDTSRAGQS